MSTQQNIHDSTAKTVLSFIEALNKQDYKAARQYIADDMKFEGVMGTRDGADVYIADMEHMKFKYDIKKVFTDVDDICLFYNIDMGGKVIFSSGWYHVIAGKIAWFKVIF